MITIKIDEEYLLELFVARVKYWTKDEDEIELFRKMYENYIDGGVFDGSEVDINHIVDYDHYDMFVLCKGEDEYEKIKETYASQGPCDYSSESSEYGSVYIEAEYNNMFLLRPL